MNVPRCDVCGGGATIHESEISGGVVVERHFCQAHGEKLLRDAAETSRVNAGAGALSELEAQWRLLSPAERQHLVLLHRLTRRNG